jgi:glutamate dehydrogenase
LQHDAAELEGVGVPSDLASDIARLAVLVETPALVATAERSRAPIVEAARAYLAVSSHLRIDEIVAKAQELTPADDYERLAIGGSVASLDDALRRLAVSFLAAGSKQAVGLEDWLERGGPMAMRVRQDLQAIASSREMSVARLAVASVRIAALAQSIEAGRPAVV